MDQLVIRWADGTVDAADYTVWRNGLGSIFYQSDYNVWVYNFGTSAISQSVPEPTNAVLLFFGSLITLRRKH